MVVPAAVPGPERFRVGYAFGGGRVRPRSPAASGRSREYCAPRTMA